MISPAACQQSNHNQITIKSEPTSTFAWSRNLPLSVEPLHTPVHQTHASHCSISLPVTVFFCYPLTSLVSPPHSSSKRLWSRFRLICSNLPAAVSHNSTLCDATQRLPNTLLCYFQWQLQQTATSLQGLCHVRTDGRVSFEAPSPAVHILIARCPLDPRVASGGAKKCREQKVTLLSGLHLDNRFICTLNDGGSSFCILLWWCDSLLLHRAAGCRRFGDEEFSLSLTAVCSVDYQWILVSQLCMRSWECDVWGGLLHVRLITALPYWPQLLSHSLICTWKFKYNLTNKISAPDKVHFTCTWASH